MSEAKREGAEALLEILERLAGVHAWVIGDLMLDEYVSGAVDRISPEAPVPVVRVRETEFRLGGAANVARQVAALGARVSLAGAVGGDATGERLIELCASAGIDTRAVAKLSDRTTTRKLRVLGHSQQLLRLDWEDTGPCPPAIIDRAIGQLATGPSTDAIILSDYAKGVLTPQSIGAVLAARGTAPVIVDPKHRDFSR